MLKPILSNRVALTALMRAAWWVLYTGRDIATASGALEGSEEVTWLTRLSWKLRDLGEGIERLEGRMEARVSGRAEMAGIDIEEVLAPLVDARSR